MRWTVDYKAPLRPIYSGRTLDVSRLTVVLAAPLLWSLLLGLLREAVVGAGPTHLHLTPYLQALSTLGALAVLLAPLSLLSLVFDNVRRWWRVRHDRTAEIKASIDRQLQLREALGPALKRIYEEHHAALVKQVGGKFKADAYGRLDTAAAAQELNYFQEQVAVPALTAKGYPKALVDQRFEADRETLLRPILKSLA